MGWLRAVLMVASGAALVVWYRHRAVTSQLRRRLAAHRSQPAPRRPAWWERATVSLGPVAGWVEARVSAVVTGRPQLAGLATALDQARVASTPTEVLAAGLVAGVASALGALTLGAPAPVSVLIAVVVTGAPSGVVAVLAARRRAAFAAELPDVLALLAGTLRAGVPLTAALEAVAGEAGGPVAPELQRVAGETALGRPLPEALVAMGRRMRSDEVAWVGMAVEIHQQAGGNLAEVLDTVARTVADGQRLRREVAALTAEGRLSAIVLGVLPVGLAAVITVVNPGYLATLVQAPMGTTLLVGAGAGMVVGFVWMRRIVDVGR